MVLGSKQDDKVDVLYVVSLGWRFVILSLRRKSKDDFLMPCDVLCCLQSVGEGPTHYRCESCLRIGEERRVCS